MALHPAIDVTWYGAAMYCNWLSESQGLTPCYDTDLWTCDFAANGYHLPTEAQWERAAAWDAALNKHWIYGFMSDTLTGKNRCNYYDGDPNYVNPFGLTDYPFTSPVGWFDGVNMSPNGGISTEDSVSPVGCYDMSGNVWEWCNDWYGSYTSETVMNPTGPTSGSSRVLRGGSWAYALYYCRSAYRGDFTPASADGFSGFRVSRTP